jgi:type IV pilus assembly protein PilC
MPVYSYIARDTNTGKTIKAEVKADSERIATNLLLKRNLVPSKISIKSQSSFSFANRVKTKDRILFTRQLATLINAGLPLTQSLKTVSEQSSSKPLQEVTDQIVHDVEGGSTLADTFAKHPKVFNQVYIALIAAGEASGTLDKTLERIATQQEKDAEVTSKIRGAMMYPAIVLLVIAGVMGFLFTAVLPQIKQLYDDLNKDLPFVTAVMLFISDILIKWWWLVLIILGLAVYAAIVYAKTDDGKAVFDKIKMKTPLFGALFMKLYMARFCRTASTLLSSGVPMLDMLNVTSRAVNNVHIAKTIQESSAVVKSGGALSTSLKDKPTFLTLVPQMIRIGEQSGALDAMLKKSADFYESELDNDIKSISTIIEPALMVVLALMAGLMVGAVLLPVYSLVGTSIS